MGNLGRRPHDRKWLRCGGANEVACQFAVIAACQRVRCKFCKREWRQHGRCLVQTTLNLIKRQGRLPRRLEQQVTELHAKAAVLDFCTEWVLR